ncbi:GNAT family N-acetyltransferase [Agrobacterium sp. CG160-95]|uniref:GNAT family N-acetyltransferase n=1 Tax=Agrobacterium TaxID=357 RepID=UPI0009CB8F7C|nr:MULTISPECIES: GNAT family N-acetyltransferase [Agrobacterium]MDP9559129.1 ribosomal protein S18 acetylase RimI-like enzyme [Rhizobium nepotum]WCA69781.1 GNAT family N-acetyltransferase [Agrobacterium tumefaciens]CUW86865.1 GCN5-related N-acetyltransferase [Agrobacterium fabacearum S56]
MTETRFRLALPHEALIVKEISAAAYIPAYLQIVGAAPEPAFEDYLPRISAEQVWFSVTDGETSGLVVLESHHRYLMIYSIAVSPIFQGRGIGKSLLRFAELHALECGIGELRLYTNMRMTKNIALYSDCGFEECGRRPHPSREGEILIDMKKSVA